MKFKKVLDDKGMRIVEVGKDGNCLFRAIAHQAYGDEELHSMLRQKCIQYIKEEKNFYKDYIIGGQSGSFDQYIERKALDGIWGDDIEIQALSELYNRPIEIYAYSNTPMRTFHENQSL